jgi:uncharacterized membrane protein YfcA
MFDYTVLAGIVALAFIAELIDASLGMMYGTILSPLLILIGFDPLVSVPALLFSQAVGGLIAATKHHKHGNANLHFTSEDFKSFLTITIPGLLAVCIGALVALNVSKELLKLYIAFLVIIVGIMVTFRISSEFSWKKMGAIGFVSAFNKALSGGGFGPFVTGGQVAIGQKSKNAVGITTLAEVPICMGSFIAYLLLNGGFDSWPFLGALVIGAAVGGALGPRITKAADEEKLKFAVGVFALVSGLILLNSVLGII